MKRELIVDASVAVKWLNAQNEEYADEALDVLRGAVEKQHTIIIPDLLYYEVVNALVRGKSLSGASLERALDVLFSLPVTVESMIYERVALAGKIAAVYVLSVYDAVYVALAIEHDAPLITANSKHQGKVRGHMIVDIRHWRSFSGATAA